MQLLTRHMDHHQRRQVAFWYAAGAVLILITLLIGGVTRLTDSGLSIVEWKPILGVFPPTSEAGWQDAFEQYRQYPEYQERNRGMSLSEFQFIYFWEYLHRMSGRAVGLLFLIPFGYFFAVRALDRRQFRRALLLLILGGAQGALGWFMVQSGLIEQPWVSHYRLAAHLLLAFVLFACCIWFMRDLQGTIRLAPVESVPSGRTAAFRRLLWGIAALMLIQVVWGAFMAGLKAGHIYNTFPLMSGGWLPPGDWEIRPAIRNIAEQPSVVQWIHRWLGMLLVLGGLLLWLETLRSERYRPERVWSGVLAGAFIIQGILGIATLIFHVQISLAVAHQVAAMLIFGYLLAWIHRLRMIDPETGWKEVWLTGRHSGKPGLSMEPVREEIVCNSSDRGGGL